MAVNWAINASGGPLPTRYRLSIPLLNSVKAAAVGLLILMGLPGCGNKELTTHTRYLPSAKLTVVHVFSPTCGPCKMMHDDWVAFESSYKNKVKIVAININDKESEEFKSYKAVLDAAGGGVPFTAWLDNDGKILAQQGGAIDKKLLGGETLMLDMKLRKKK